MKNAIILLLHLLSTLARLIRPGGRRAVIAENRCMELVEERVTPAPPRLEPIVPNSGNRLKTKPFTLPQGVNQNSA